MTLDFKTLKEHLERTGRVKLLPQVLREFKQREAREKALAPRKETAKENPLLIAGWRSIEDGVLIDRSAKRALIDIYQKVTAE
jgi:hypothetical protein